MLLRYQGDSPAGTSPWIGTGVELHPVGELRPVIEHICEVFPPSSPSVSPPQQTTPALVAAQVCCRPAENAATVPRSGTSTGTVPTPRLKEMAGVESGETGKGVSAPAAPSSPSWSTLSLPQQTTLGPLTDWSAQTLPEPAQICVTSWSGLESLSTTCTDVGLQQV